MTRAPNGLILQLAAEKKAPFLVQLKQIFGPSYLVRALEGDAQNCDQ